MRRSSFFFVLLTFVLNTSFLASEHTVESGFVLQEPIEQRMKELGIPGVSITVINNGQIAWSKGYGELENPKYRTQAASISKTVTALAILSLVQDGKLDLDDDVSDILDEKVWEKIDPQGLTKDKEHAVTIRRILSHTAGINVPGFEGYSRDQKVPSNVDEILFGKGNSMAVQVEWLPGTKMAYSGGGTTILQKVIEVSGGKSFAEVVSERVFSKIGMQDSTYYPKEDEIVCGNGLDGKPISGSFHSHPELAAAGLWTTSKDIAKMAIAIQKSLAGENGAIFDKKLIQEMVTPQTEGRTNGLGVFVDTLSNTLVFSHTGSNVGFRCIMIANDHGQGAVIMTNSDRGDILQTELLTAIAKENKWSDAAEMPQCNKI